MRRAAVVFPLFEICGFNLPRGAQPIPALQFSEQSICGGDARLEPSDKKDGGKAKAVLIVKVDALMKACAPQHAIEHCQVGGRQWMPLSG
ncbi:MULTISPECIES: hypothetical protein [Ensifer]|uniref:hypothetical protein n=1 Tax=Ensifer TaxID=106591 RepID=UPI0008075066|nr:hypothetical protein [Ensifer adhaerens]